jgi:hypothetical protein
VHPGQPDACLIGGRDARLVVLGARNGIQRAQRITTNLLTRCYAPTHKVARSVD